MSDLSKIFSQIVGEDYLISSSIPGPHQSCTFKVDTNYHYLVVQPSCEDEVVACLKAAFAQRLTFYVVSQGKNWGYGSARPSSAVDWVLDLQRLDRIIGVDEEWGFATIQPGVTFRQLALHLKQTHPGWLVDLTGGPVSGSVLGNALTNGHGLGPQGCHSDSLFNLSVVTPDGQLIQAGSDRFHHAWKASRLQGKFPGPDYDRLFIQSNFAITLKASFKLTETPEIINGYLIPVSDEPSLNNLIKRLSKLRVSGIIRGIPVFSDDLRILLPEFSISDLGAMSLSDRDKECQKRGIGKWNLYFSSMGESYYVSMIRRMLEHELRDFRIIVASERNKNMMPYMSQCFDLLRNNINDGFDWSTHLHVQNKPQNNTGISGIDGCGIVFVTTTAPMEKEAFYTVRNIVQEHCQGNSIIYTIQAFHMKGMTLNFYIRICYDRLIFDDGIGDIVCKIQKDFMSKGYALSRTSHLDNQYYSLSDRTISSLLKKAFDPQGLLVNDNFKA